MIMHHYEEPPALVAQVRAVALQQKGRVARPKRPLGTGGAIYRRQFIIGTGFRVWGFRV